MSSLVFAGNSFSGLIKVTQIRRDKGNTHESRDTHSLLHTHTFRRTSFAHSTSKNKPFFCCVLRPSKEKHVPESCTRKKVGKGYGLNPMGLRAPRWCHIFCGPAAQPGFRGNFPGVLAGRKSPRCLLARQSRIRVGMFGHDLEPQCLSRKALWAVDAGSR